MRRGKDNTISPSVYINLITKTRPNITVLRRRFWHLHVFIFISKMCIDMSAISVYLHDLSFQVFLFFFCLYLFKKGRPRGNSNTFISVSCCPNKSTFCQRHNITVRLAFDHQVLWGQKKKRTEGLAFWTVSYFCVFLSMVKDHVYQLSLRHVKLMFTPSHEL